MIGLLYIALAHAAPQVTKAEPSQEAVQFALRRGDMAIAGLSVFVADDESHGLLALSPMGVELFHVKILADDVVIDGPEQWIGTLKRLPWRRDIGLLHLWRCEHRKCSAPGGRIKRRATQDGEQLRWRGMGGPAIVTHAGDSSTLRDPRRGYTLQIITGSAQ